MIASKPLDPPRRRHRRGAALRGRCSRRLSTCDLSMFDAAQAKHVRRIILTAAGSVSRLELEHAHVTPHRQCIPIDDEPKIWSIRRR